MGRSIKSPEGRELGGRGTCHVRFWFWRCDGKFLKFGIWDKVTVVPTVCQTIGLRSPDRSGFCGRPGVEQHQHVEHQSRICMVRLVTQHTAVTRQIPAAKSHPFGSNTLHLVPVEHLHNLVATHPVAVELEWSNHFWDPFLPVFLVDSQASLSASSLSLLKGMCTRSVCVLWVFYAE